MNNFSFDDKHYLQMHGTAMGTRMAPSYANLFLAKLETDTLSRAPHQPHTWWCYIDDIFMIWTHFCLHSVSSILHKHFNILSSSVHCANVFKAVPFVTFRRTNNLSKLLVSANQPHGSFLCGSNSLTCKYITVGLNTYTFHSTGETRPINHHIDCNSINVIYMVQCKRCHKQYIGETKQRLKDRFNEHRRPVDKQINISKPTTVSEHFLSNGHNATDMQLIPLELIKSNCDWNVHVTFNRKQVTRMLYV